MRLLADMDYDMLRGEYRLAYTLIFHLRIVILSEKKNYMVAMKINIMM